MQTLKYSMIHRVYDHCLGCVICGDIVEPGFIACISHNASWQRFARNKIGDDTYVTWYTGLAANKEQLDLWLRPG